MCLEACRPQWIGRTPTEGKMACASAATVARSLTEKLRCESCAATHLSNCVCKHRRHWCASCKRPSQALRTQSSAFGRGCRSCSSSSNRRLGHLGHLQQQLQQQPHSNRRLGHLQQPYNNHPGHRPGHLQQPHRLGHRPSLHSSSLGPSLGHHRHHPLLRNREKSPRRRNSCRFFHARRRRPC